MVVAAVAFVVVAVQVARPTAAEAVLGEIAAAAELVEPLTVDGQEFAYVRSETLALGVFPADAFTSTRGGPLAYLIPSTREVWIGADDTVQLRTTTGTPRFFAPGDETDYYTAGLDVIDGVGEITAETFDNVTSILDERTWPTTPDDLEDALRHSLPPELERPESVEILDLALDLIRLPDAPPTLRAAALRVIADLDLTLVERRPDGGGTFTIAYDQPEPATITVTLSGIGQLIYESVTLDDGDPSVGIPPGTITAEATYEPARIVSDLNN